MGNSLKVSEENGKSFTKNVNNSNQELFSTKQIADQLTVDKRTIQRVAKKCFPTKKIENGKTTFYTKEEVAILLDYMQSKNNRSDLPSTTVVQVTTTELTPSLRMIQAMEMFKAAADEELARLRAENVSLNNYKFDTEKKLANGELIETPSENVRNHLWQNIQKVGSAMNDYRKAWHEFWNLVKRDISLDVKTRAANKEMKCLDYICNELDMETFNKIYALSEKMKKEYCGK
jgi:hypothetical protein